MLKELNRRDLFVRSVGAGMACAAARPGRTSGAAETPALRRGIWDAPTHLSGFVGAVEQRVAQLLSRADRMGIERLVLSMGTSFVQDPSPEELVRQNDEVLRAVAHAPHRLFGFVYVNPKHTRASVSEMDRWVQDGPMVGVKLWVAVRCYQPELDPIVRRAVELRIPLLPHCFWRVGENLPGESTPAKPTSAAIACSGTKRTAVLGGCCPKTFRRRVPSTTTSGGGKTTAFGSTFMIRCEAKFARKLDVTRRPVRASSTANQSRPPKKGVRGDDAGNAVLARNPLDSPSIRKPAWLL